MKIFFLFAIFSFCSAFFQTTNFYEKYEFYYNHSSLLKNCAVGVKPIARLAIGASSAIPKSSLILKVPSTHIITTFDPFPWSSLFAHENHVLKAEALVVSFKLLNSTFFSEYIHQFPWFLDSPSTWLLDELIEYLQKFIDCPEEVDASLASFEAFKKIVRNIPGVKGFAYEKKNYAWAQTFVKTFAIPVSLAQWKVLHKAQVEKGDEEVRGLAFVPFMELFNQYVSPDVHYSEANEYPLEFVAGFVELRASREFKLGQEVYMPMSRKNNYQLLRDSGFVIEQNSNDRLKIKEETKEFLLSPLELDLGYLKSFEGFDQPLMQYRKGVKKTILEFKHALRHLRRRLRILDDRFIRLTFQLSISEKVCAYHSLAIVERNILKTQMSSLRLA